MKQSKLVVFTVSAASCTGSLCDCISLEVDAFTTRTVCTKICSYIALHSHEMKTFYVFLRDTVFKLLVKLLSIVSKLLGRKLDTIIYHRNYIRINQLAVQAAQFYVLTKPHKSYCIFLVQTHKYIMLLVRFTCN